MRVVFENVGFCSCAGSSYQPLLLLTMATTASVGKVQCTCMLLRLMTGYLIVFKILWNYGKLLFHAHSDYSLNNNTTVLACPMGCFGFLQHWWHFCGSSIPSWYFRSLGALPDQASSLQVTAPLSPCPAPPAWVQVFAWGHRPLL